MPEDAALIVLVGVDASDLTEASFFFTAPLRAARIPFIVPQRVTSTTTESAADGVSASSSTASTSSTSSNSYDASHQFVVVVPAEAEAEATRILHDAFVVQDPRAAFVAREDPDATPVVETTKTIDVEEVLTEATRTAA